MIDKRLYDKVGMIADGGDSVGSTCYYAICYNISGLYYKIYAVYDYKNDIIYRSIYHAENHVNDISRDHIFWIKIAQKYFKLKWFEAYIKELKPFSKISDAHRMTPDLWLYCRNHNLLWQLSLCITLPVNLVWKKFIHWIAGLKEYTPETYIPKRRTFSDGVKFISSFNEMFDLNRIFFIKMQGWGVIEYLFSEIWIVTMATYTVRQTAFALYVSKKIPVISDFIGWCLRRLTWKNNPLIALLTDRQPRYDISPYYTDVCGKEMNQRNQDPVELKTPENEYKCRIYQDLINKKKNHERTKGTKRIYLPAMLIQ